MMSKETSEEHKCALSEEEEHFVIDPIALTNCGHFICKKCGPVDNDIKNIKCKLCEFESQQDFSQDEFLNFYQNFSQIDSEEFFKILKNKTALKMNELKRELI
jgi:hypothetical protein